MKYKIPLRHLAVAATFVFLLCIYLAPAQTLQSGIPSTNGKIWAMAQSGDTLYIGGEFTTVGATTRNRIAAIKLSTGNLLPFNPNSSSTVYSLAVLGTTVYAGGDFTTIGGQTRNRIAALNASNGNATSWDPNSSSTVRTLAISGITIYAGGDFTTIGGQTRNRIAALSISSNTATSWNPNGSSTVYALAVSGTTIYAGGDFTTIGGQTRNYIATLDASSNTATSWNPNANGKVYTLAISGTTIYAGGDFTTIGGQTRNRIAALNSSSNTATSWDPNANSSVYAITLSNTIIYAGGDFTTIGGQSRNRIAAFSASSNTATSWNPNANSKVYSLARSVSPSYIYAGGEYTSILGATQQYIAGITPDGADAVLPVELVDFSLQAFSNKVSVKWTTASEVDNAGFEILRSSGDENPFKRISSYISSRELRGLGTSPFGKNYSFTDTDVEAGVYFYKIVDIAFDGTRKEHEAKSILVAESFLKDPSVEVFPNPASDFLKVKFPVAEAGTVKIEIYSPQGAKIQTIVQENVPAGVQELSVPLMGIAQGKYTIYITTSKAVTTAGFAIVQ